MDDPFNEVSKALDAAICHWIDEKCQREGACRLQLTIQAGKALVMFGSTLLGNSMGISDFETGTAPGRECLDRYRKMAEEIAKRRGESQ